MVKKNKTEELKIYQPMRYRVVYFMISLTFLLPGIFSLIKNGLKPSIDFTGGSSIVITSDNLDRNKLEQLADNQGLVIKEIANNSNKWTITTDPINRDQHQQFLDTLSTEVEFEDKEFTTVGPSLGKELIVKTITGVIIAGILILLYVTYRFRNIKFGATAILAMLHDTFILIGVFSLLGFYRGVEVDTLFVTAVLTILSFSVHDTIVVYDRIRELKKHHGYLEFEEVVNRAVVETLGRSINNSMTIIFMLLAMYLMGGDTIKWFIFALLIGTISGTYSSTFTAAPLLVVWDKISLKKKGK